MLPILKNEIIHTTNATFSALKNAQFYEISENILNIVSLVVVMVMMVGMGCVVFVFVLMLVLV